ncbi:MAG: hypothetical protein ACW991_00725 [Candidatus Hodarchaeales archaeon]
MIDIEKVYGSEEELIAAVWSDKTPFRNDVCRKLKDYYNDRELFEI